MAETTQTSPKTIRQRIHLRRSRPRSASGLRFTRKFSKAGVSPYDEVQWERRTAAITDASGKTIFEQKDVEVPVDWSMTATNIVASKYLHGQIGHARARDRRPRPRRPRRRDHPRLGPARAATSPLLKTPPSSTTSSSTCSCTQKVAFNSPVWFNVGCDRARAQLRRAELALEPAHLRSRVLASPAIATPQCSACFINAVDDSLDSILTLAKTEGMLFKWGSGTGHQSLAHPRLDGAALRRRHRLRPAQLHARLRRLRRRHQVRRQDPPRRQDGHPQRRPSRHRRLHRVQGEGRSQGLGPHARGLRRLLRPRLRSLQLDLLPERQQLRPRHRRVHAAPVENDGDFTTHTVKDHDTRRRPTRRATSCTRSPKPPGSAAIPACSTTPPSTAGTPRRTPAASTRPIPARSTCSSTTPPATWPAST